MSAPAGSDAVDESPSAAAGNAFATPPEPPLPEPPLPDGVRQRVLELAAAALSRIPAPEVPRSLHAVARFRPASRARLGAAALAAALATEPDFRSRVAEAVRETAAELAAAVDGGRSPAAAEPVEVAALGYLLRPAGWPELVERARVAVEQATELQRAASHAQKVDRLAAELQTARAALRGQAEQAQRVLAKTRSVADDLRRRLREQTEASKRAEQRAADAEDALASERAAAAARQSAGEAENRRLRARLEELEAAVETARRTAREARTADDVRLWLLVDTVVSAAQGLRRELALTPPDERPADAVAAEAWPPTATPIGWSGTGDVAGLDQLLALPRAHLIVDGYNVTKTGYPELPLQSQRGRLVSALGALAAQTQVEITVAFDGAQRLVAAPAAPRGVRVLFSQPGEIADEVIRRLVRAEPQGRPVIVVSADRELADSVRRSGAYTVASTVLVQRLERA